jgi:hypothetical protein
VREFRPAGFVFPNRFFGAAQGHATGLLADSATQVPLTELALHLVLGRQFSLEVPLVFLPPASRAPIKFVPPEDFPPSSVTVHYLGFYRRW